jgi:hypothetical protein
MARTVPPEPTSELTRPVDRRRDGRAATDTPKTIQSRRQDQGETLVSTTGYTATPIQYAEAELDEIAFNADGLVAAIVQD